MTLLLSIVLSIHIVYTGGSLSCDHDGQLLPNSADCRKYFKCSNGAPSKQSCPGTLIFDPVLKICNWPDSTTCVVDIKPKVPIRSKTVRKESSENEDADTAREERNKDKFSSLFHVKERDLSRLRERHKNLRNRMRIRAQKEKEEQQKEKEESRQRSRESNFRDEEEDVTSFRNRGSSSFRNRGSSFDDDSDSSNERVISRNRGSSSFRSRGSSFEDEGDSSNERVTSRNRGSSLFRNRGSSFDDSSNERVTSRNSFRHREQEVKRTTKKPARKPIKCLANNELHANPQNCRKYFKCENGLPSLQSCPSNLIFDSGLSVCNWPDATECDEDPDAVLPELGSSDRHPPRSRKPSFHDDFVNTEEAFFAPEQPKAFPEQGSVPSEREALAREKLLTEEYPLFKKVKETVRTLHNDEVEEIRPNRKENPDNVKRVEFILSEENYEDLFPRRHPSYTYTRFIQAIGIFPAVCAYVGSEKESEAICRKTLATMFAHFTQETGNHNPSDKEYDEWRQGLSSLREQGCTDTSPGCGYNENCEDKDSITKKWACGQDRAGKWKKYYGRGAKQLSYNFNYGQFSQAMFGDGRILLDHPDFVADTYLNMASATWFYATPQPPKPSMLHVIDGTWEPNIEDRRNGIKPGFGATINIINGGLECNTEDGRESKQARNRIEYYKQFAWYLYVDYDREELGCANQQQFSAGGAGALPIYWDKDWVLPYTCKLVNYQTAHSALVPGEYVDCVEENFGVKIR